MFYGSTSLMDLLSGVHVGFISQNVYLYCASEGLSTVDRTLVDLSALSKAMKLRPDQKSILVQSGAVGGVSNKDIVAEKTNRLDC